VPIHQPQLHQIALLEASQLLYYVIHHIIKKLKTESRVLHETVSRVLKVLTRWNHLKTCQMQMHYILLERVYKILNKSTWSIG